MFMHSKKNVPTLTAMIFIRDSDFHLLMSWEFVIRLTK